LFIVDRSFFIICAFPPHFRLKQEQASLCIQNLSETSADAMMEKVNNKATGIIILQDDWWYPV